MNKADARAYGLQARKSLSEAQRQEYDRLLLKQMKQWAEHASMIGCYVSMKDEADTHAFLNWCFAEGKKIAVPRVADGTLVFHRICSLSELHHGAFGVLEPDADTERVQTDAIDVMFVPLSAFDSQYHRTGYGKGYYDSVLTASMKKIGLAYPEQKTEERIETEPHDMTLDTVLIPL